MDAFGSLPDVLREVGYMATANVQDCLTILGKAGQINAPTVARALYIMGKTLVGLEQDPAVASSIIGRELSPNEMLPKVNLKFFDHHYCIYFNIIKCIKSIQDRIFCAHSGVHREEDFNYRMKQGYLPCQNEYTNGCF